MEADIPTPAEIREHWEQRFGQHPDLFGKAPHPLVEKIAGALPAKSRTFLPGDGEGRNGVWLAELGHGVTTLDISPTAVEHARAEAKSRGVEPDIRLGDLAEEAPALASPGSWDAIVSIFMHLPDPAQRHAVAAVLSEQLREGGTVHFAASYGVTCPETLQLEWPGLEFPSVGQDVAEGVFWITGRKTA